MNLPGGNATTYTKDYLSFLRGKDVWSFISLIFEVCSKQIPGECVGTYTVIIPSSEITTIGVIPGGTHGFELISGAYVTLELDHKN